MTFLYVAWFKAPGEPKLLVSAHTKEAAALHAARVAVSHWTDEHSGTGFPDIGYDHVSIGSAVLKALGL